MKMGTHKKECEIEEIDEFWENYSTIKRKIRNVESHIVYIEEDLPESEEIVAQLIQPTRTFRPLLRLRRDWELTFHNPQFHKIGEIRR